MVAPELRMSGTATPREGSLARTEMSMSDAAAPISSASLTPVAVLQMARYLGVDIERGQEFYLLAVAREAALVKVEYPWEATRDETGAARYVNRVTKEILDRHPLDDRFLALVQRLRDQNASKPPPPRDAPPRTCMRLAGYPAPATPIYDFALNRWIAEEFAGKDRMIQLLPSAQVPRLTAVDLFGETATRTRAVASTTGLDFESWWDEENQDSLGVFLDNGEHVNAGLRRRKLRVAYDMGSGRVGAFTDVAGRSFELPLGEAAGPRDPWDFYVGGNVTLLGRSVTLMAASCSTRAWVDHHGKVLEAARQTLLADVVKYAPRRRGNDVARGVPMGGGRAPLRQLLKSCASLIDELARFCPSVAARHAEALADYLVPRG